MNEPKNRLASLIRELTSLLYAQESEIRGMTGALRERRNHFISGRAETLDAANEALEAVAKRCFELEQRRLRVMHEISEYVGLPVPALTSSRLERVVRGLGQNGFGAQARRTRAAAEDLRLETKVGESLLDWSARWHEGLMQELARSCKDVPTYARNGRENKQSGNGFVDAWL
jgi:hypothetical protein